MDISRRERLVMVIIQGGTGYAIGEVIARLCASRSSGATSDEIANQVDTWAQVEATAVVKLADQLDKLLGGT